MLPQSSDDSMNYHLPAALNILSEGHLYNTPEWFLGRLAGSGEIIVALGLAVKTEHLLTAIHFSLLVQFLLMLTFSSGKHFTSWSVTMPFILIVSSPVLYMLYASAKPQFLPMMLCVSAFWLMLNYFRRESYSRQYSIFIIAPISLCFVGLASQMKYNFVLSYFIVALYICLSFFSQKSNLNTKNFFLIPCLYALCLSFLQVLT